MSERMNGSNVGTSAMGKREQRLVLYSLAAAGASVAAVGQSANAGIYQSYEFGIPQYFKQPLDLDSDGFTDLMLKNYVFFGGNYQAALVSYFPGKVVTTSPSGFPIYVTALGAGVTIDASSFSGSSFYGTLAYPGNAISEFADVTDAYIGLTFPSGADIYYGWIRVDVNNAAGTFYIHDSYVDTQPVVTGEYSIPEPTTLPLLAAGAAGLLALRRKRQAA